MKTLHFAPQRERRYPVLTAIDLILYWALSATALALAVTALWLTASFVLQSSAAQLILSRI